MRELRPLYLQLHTWVKYELARRYRQPVPKLIPAHWINNRWSQDWSGIVEAASLDDRFKDKSARVDRQNRRAVLHRPGLCPIARQLLGPV